ncbi:hypothetical protein C5L14_29600 [Labrys okinawensis]|uniref:Uncharacterized protein n=1 Tax=Labrys okinawensis TaxID=346911 RepID=A0A2S9Q3S4_9HYPH|nr:hypothetical protein C5L14_29600 [Labrys okinawensis]
MWAAEMASRRRQAPLSCAAKSILDGVDAFIIGSLSVPGTFSFECAGNLMAVDHRHMSAWACLSGPDLTWNIRRDEDCSL